MAWTSNVNRPEMITATVLVHIPFLSGYWERSIDVLRVSLDSLRRNTKIPFDLMVFDNGSCVQVQDYLLEQKRQGVVQNLILSDENIGKSGAWNILFSAAPGDIVTYSDSDVMFLSGWLEASLDVLRAFPKAGMVTAQPARRAAHFLNKNSSTLAEARQDASIRIDEGDLIPEEYLRAHRHGLGDTEAEYRQRIGSQLDVRLCKGPLSAFVSASHFQFVTTKSVLKRILPFEILRPMGDVQQLDIRVNDAGFWRLSTSKYLVHHMGNTIPPVIDGFDEVGRLGQEILTADAFAQAAPRRTKVNGNPILRYLLGKSRVRKLIRGLNSLSFRLLAEIG